MIKFNQTEKEFTGMKRIIDIAVTSSEYFADEFPKWLRPLTKLLSLAFILLFLFLMTPYFLIKRNFPNSYQTLKMDLTSTWHSESSIIALNKLREVYKLLLQNLDSVMLGGYKIESYGKFNFYDYANASELLFHWEMQHECITKASEICDEMLEPGNNAKNMSRIYADWIIKKARTIKLLDGTLAAQEYLLKYIDQDNKKCKIRKYFYELKNMS